jgi:hypothetical protein
MIGIDTYRGECAPFEKQDEVPGRSLLSSTSTSIDPSDDFVSLKERKETELYQKAFDTLFKRTANHLVDSSEAENKKNG